MLLAALYACNEPDPKKYVGTALDPLTDPTKVDTTKFNVEYLQYSTVKINGVLPLESKLKDFLKVLGKPDSIVETNDDDCVMYDVPYKEIHLQGSLFFLLNDTAVYQNLNFRRRPDLELQTPAITLNHNTTLGDVKKLFPRSASKTRILNSKEFGTLTLVDIGASKEYTDEWWILFFAEGKLVMAEMFSPC